MHVFGLWEEVEAPGENSCVCGENIKPSYKFLFKAEYVKSVLILAWESFIKGQIW